MVQKHLLKTEEKKLILITGGAYQGKSAFAQRLAGELIEGTEQPEMDGRKVSDWKILEDLHLRIAEMLKASQDPRKEMQKLIGEESRLIVTVQELGCGIVPVDIFDREWREVTGRICCELAEKAQAVYRMTCGIPTRLK